MSLHQFPQYLLQVRTLYSGVTNRRFAYNNTIFRFPLKPSPLICYQSRSIVHAHYAPIAPRPPPREYEPGRTDSSFENLFTTLGHAKVLLPRKSIPILSIFPPVFAFETER